MPILLSAPLASPTDLLAAALGFLVVCLLASSGYIINDLLDLAADRRHPTKRTRSFAAGTLSARAGVFGMLVMLAAAGTGALLLGWAFALAVLAYFADTVSYSLALERGPMLDVVLAGLFTVRVVAGTTLTAAPFSYWLITFSMVLFFSLALVKRYASPSARPGAGRIRSRTVARRSSTSWTRARACGGPCRRR